ncbi:hypothetical protein [Motiliproteus sp. MSK22-1]|uniref:hypothetical protein n=1 Tax=Motiliproteus sp. MSK22-1 TaxID=1897630 RepID=UPI00097AD2E6|nr:hypothetical protein [Motiliproteus sp. MSK22-1]OMH25259.1 hypothetical protein BGP75_26010 [Motiliproteus sp. MSK22-1]
MEIKDDPILLGGICGCVYGNATVNAGRVALPVVGTYLPLEAFFTLALPDMAWAFLGYRFCSLDG